MWQQTLGRILSDNHIFLNTPIIARLLLHLSILLLSELLLGRRLGVHCLTLVSSATSRVRLSLLGSRLIRTGWGIRGQLAAAPNSFDQMATVLLSFLARLSII